LDVSIDAAESQLEERADAARRIVVAFPKVIAPGCEIDIVVVLYAIDALCTDSKRAESLSQDLENGIGVLLTKCHRDEAAQLCGHERGL
jgi:hypothetical protein